jgi:hypothetical protein
MKGLTATLICGVGILCMPAAARADPISVTLHDAVGGFTSGGTFTVGPGNVINLGTISFAGGSMGDIEIQGLDPNVNYAVNFMVQTSNSWSTMQAEILDPLSDGFDAQDPKPQPTYVPAGFSTSSNYDGLSFAERSPIGRMMDWNGGISFATESADEHTNARDQLTFAGIPGAVGLAAVQFGVRDDSGNRPFLIHLSVNGDPVAGTATPEPASMILLGSGLLGLALTRRRRQAV